MGTLGESVTGSLRDLKRMREESGLVVREGSMLLTSSGRKEETVPPFNHLGSCCDCYTI